MCHVLPFSVPPSVGETTGPSPEAIVGQRPVHVIRDMMTIANVFNSTGGLQIPPNVVFYESSAYGYCDTDLGELTGPGGS